MRRVVALLLALWPLHAARAGSTVPVLVYADVDGSAETELVQPPGDGDQPLPGLLLRLARGADAHLLTTGDDGRAIFEGVADGTWLLRPILAPTFPEPPPCTTHNLPKRLVQKLVSGDGTPLVYVALGDSTPRLGSSEGRPYPERLAELLEPHLPGGVSLQNRADPGTVTADWLPGAHNFEAAAAFVAEADLITLTLGGNDLQHAIDGGSFASAPAVVQQAIDNLVAVTAALAELNPRADLVVTIYPNYALTDLWAEAVPANLLELVRTVVDGALVKMRARLAGLDGVLLGDVNAELAGADLNLFMADALHVNDLGHDVYAKVVFRALGGVLLPEDAGRERSFGLLAPAVPPGPDDAGEGVEEPPVDGGRTDPAEVAPEIATPPDVAPDLEADMAPEAVGEPTGGEGAAGGCASGGSPGRPTVWLGLLAGLALLAWRRARGDCTSPAVRVRSSEQDPLRGQP